MSTNTLKVDSDYPEDLDWIYFDKIASWDFPIYTGFAYDEITDEEINKALEQLSQHSIDVDQDWEDDIYLHNLDIEPKLKHALRIAKLVELIKLGQPIRPVTLDTIHRYNCGSCISNGNHRIRAIQYCGFDKFPAYCSGVVEEINKILTLMEADEY